MSGGLKEQWGVGDAAQAGPDAQSQDLKNAFEKAMDAMADHLQYTAVNGDRARQDPLAARGQGLVPRYQEALKQVDAADPAKAKPAIDSLLSDANAAGQDAASFRAETEKAVNEWQSRSGAYDGAVKQVEELCAWQHPKEGAVRALADAIRGSVNDHAYDKAVSTHDQFLPKLQPVYEDLQKQKQAQQQYEPALAALEPKLAEAAAPSFKKVAAKQAEIASSKSAMETQAQGKDFVAAVAASAALNERVGSYSEEVKQIQQAKDQYEQVATGIQAKVQAAPNPSPFKKLEAMQAELSNGQKDVESAVTSEEFEQALQKANDLGIKADNYSEQVKQIQQAKDQYEQVATGIQAKVQAAPSPSPFKKLEAMQAELSNGQKDVESSVQSEEFEQALQKATDLGTKADNYSEQVKQIQQAKDQYEQVAAEIQAKVQAAPSPSPFKKLEAMQAELSNGQKDVESSVQSEEFEQALQKANDLGTKADDYSEQVKQIQQAKDQYEQVATEIQAKVQAAPSPSPFKKLEAVQAELSNGQTDMESSVQSEEFEQALQKATDLGKKADDYSEQVKQIQQAKDQYEQVATEIQTKVQAAPSPSPFKKLEAMQAELSNGQKDVESSAQSEEFEQALTKATDLGKKADDYSEQVKQIQQAKDQYEQVYGEIQAKVQSAPSPSPFKKLEAMQAELSNGQKAMESSVQSEEFEQALQKANDLGTKADNYSEQVKQIQQAKDQYEQVSGGIQAKVQAAPNPSPFKKLEAMQAELSNGQKDVESAVTSEEFEQALQKATDLGTKADDYSEQVKQIQQAKDQYEQVATEIQAKLQAAPSPSPFKKLEAMQAELSNGQKDMESSVQSEEFEQALQKANDLGTKADNYSEQVKQIQHAKDQYEQVSTEIQAKVQAAPSPSPFKKLEAMQAELSNGQKDVESAVTSEEFEQALQKATDLGTKADNYSEQVKQIRQAKDQYEQAATEIQAKVQAAPSPSPFKKLEAMQAELSNGQKDVKSSVQSEEFEQALAKTTDLGKKADDYSEQVKQIQQAKDQYEQVSGEIQAKVQAAPSPSPFKKLEAMQAELSNGQKDMESSVQSEEFEQALQKANDLGTKADNYSEQVKQIQQAKDQYEQVATEIQAKVQAAPSPSPFKKLEAMQAELSNGQKDMESSVQSEEFEQALQKATDLGKKADDYSEQVKQIQQAKDQYEQVATGIQAKVQAAPNPSPFKKLEAMQAELSNGQKDMESSATAEEFDQALQKATALGTKADNYSEQVKQIQQAKDRYEQMLTPLQRKLEAISESSPPPQLLTQKAEIEAGLQTLENTAQSESFDEALKQASELDVKADNYNVSLAKTQDSDAEDGPGHRKLEKLDRGDGDQQPTEAGNNSGNLLGSPPTPGSKSGTLDIAPPGTKDASGEKNKGATFTGPLTNPFDAPEALLEIEKLAVEPLKAHAKTQALAAQAEFNAAIEKVKKKVDKAAKAAQEARELKWTVVLTICFLPAGPLAAAAGSRVAGSAMQSKMMGAIVERAADLEAKFGAKGAQAANKAFDVVASEALTKLAAKWTPEKAQGALDAGVGFMKGKAVTFAASTDKFATTSNYFDAMQLQANGSMHNLLDFIENTKTYDEALAFYNMFAKPLQTFYEAMLQQQADDMLAQVAGALSNPAKDKHSLDPRSDIGDAVYKVKAYGRTLFAHVEVFVKPDQLSDSYKFVKWVTPDMEQLAEKVSRGELAANEIEGHLPDPQREPGERVVAVEGWNRKRLMLISIEDTGIFWKEYGVRRFKRWPANDEEEKAFASRGSIQIGGIDKVDLASIKDLKPPP